MYSTLTAEEKEKGHQERLEAVRQKSEITRLKNLMKHEEVQECVARNKVHESKEDFWETAMKRVEEVRRRYAK